MEVRHELVRGWIVVGPEAGRALREPGCALPADVVLSHAGEFGAGDPVYVVGRGRDGGQRVVAVAIAQCGSDVLAAASDAAEQPILVRADELVRL